MRGCFASAVRPMILTSRLRSLPDTAIQFKRLASPLLASRSASRLNAVEVEMDNLYSAYDAKAELDALLPEIDAALERLDDDGELHVPDGSSIVGEPSGRA